MTADTEHGGQRVAAEGVIGGNSTTTIWMPSGSWIYISVKPQGSVAGSRMMWTAAAASRACPAWTSCTWIQIITECPGGGVCPETSSKPGPRKNTTRGLSGWPNSR
jgi:hypothetical protein